MAELGVTSFQFVLLLGLISVAMCATLPVKDEGDNEGVVAADPSTRMGVGVVAAAASIKPMVLAPRFPPSLGLSRAKRYIGWGRRPGMRYSKASDGYANWDFDGTFNKNFNKYDKKAQIAPEAPISSFRELRMKQKVPNAQLLLPHLFNRNNRIADADPQGGDVVELNEDDIEALLYLLEEYAKNSRGTNEQ